MADFSIAGDITPMKFNNFRPNLRGEELDALDARYSGAQNAALDSQLKTAKDMVALRDSNLRYEMNLDVLQSRRDAAQRERDYEARMPEFLGAITNAMGEEDPAAKVAELQMTNPYLARSAAGSAAISGAFTYLDAKNKEATRREMDLNKRRSAVAPYASTGNIDKLREKNREDGVLEPWEKDMEDQTQWQIEQGRKQLGDTQFKAEADLLNKSKRTWVNSQYKLLDGLQDVGEDVNEYAKRDDQGNLLDDKGKIKPPPPLKLKPQSKRKLQALVARLQGVSPKDVRDGGMSDQELMDTAYGGLNQWETQLDQSQYPSLRSGGGQGSSSNMADQWGNTTPTPE